VYVLEAVLIGPQGVCIPLMAEFCENDDAKTKQDCELKAFYRLAGRLKRLFPKLRLTIVADGLYPCGPVMGICRRNNWDFMIVLPSDSLKTVWEEAQALHRLEPENTRAVKRGNRDQRFWWANDIRYDWNDAKGPHHIKVHVAVCNETWEEDGQSRGSTWAWVSGAPITQRT